MNTLQKFEFITLSHINFLVRSNMLNSLTISSRLNFKISSQEISIQWFWVILILHLVLAYFYQGYSHPDEHFQILEFANYKIYRHPFQYPWELYTKMRPSIQVWGVVALKYLLPNASPFHIAFLTRAFSGILSAYATYLFISTFQKELKSSFLKSWFLLLSIFSYFALYQSVRYSSENISGQLFLIGFCLVLRETKHVFLTGMILGLAFIVRFQSGFLIFGFGLWLFFIKKSPFLKLMILLSGVLFSILIGFVLDSLFYDSWTLSSWNYLYHNIILNKASAFGISYWTYLSIAYYLPWGPLYLLGTIYFIISNYKHPITWSIIPFIIVHQILPHKELRFFWPMLSFFPLASAYFLEKLERKVKINPSENPMMRFINKTNWYINNLIILSMILIFNHLMDNYKFLWVYLDKKPYTLNVWTYSKTLETPNSVSSKMSHRFYLNQDTLIQQYNNTHPFSCPPSKNCILWEPCSRPILGYHLVFDSCPSAKLYAFGNFNDWKERSNIFKNKGRLYQIFPNQV